MAAFLGDRVSRTGIFAAGVLAAGALAGGCQSTANFPGGGRYEDVAWYSGEGCDQVRDSDAEAGGPRKFQEIDYDPRLHTLLAVCERSKVPPRYRNDGEHFREDKIPPFDGWRVHDTYEGQPLDPIQTALLVVMVVDGHPGLRDPNERRSRIPAAGGLRKTWGMFEVARAEWEQKPPEAYGAVGLAHVYAEETKATELRAALAKARVPEEAIAVFEERFTEARSLLRTIVLGMSPFQKKVFVEIPREIFKERRLYRELHKDLYSRLDDVLEGAKSKGTPAPLGKLLALRSEYVATCGAASCTFEPFYMNVTRELARACVQVKDALCAHAEGNLLRRKGFESQQFSNVVTDAQWKVALPAREAYELREKARQKNIDDATASAVTGNVAPVLFTNRHFFRSRVESPRYTELLDRASEPATESGAVASIKKKGETATLEFRTDYRSEEEAYNCRSTGRLEAVSLEGQLVWEESCQTRMRQVPLPKPDAVVLPASEASGLQPGELVTVLVARGDPARNARVVTAYRGAELVQVRGDRLTVKGAASGKGAPAASGKPRGPG